MKLEVHNGAPKAPTVTLSLEVDSDGDAVLAAHISGTRIELGFISAEDGAFVRFTFDPRDGRTLEDAGFALCGGERGFGRILVD